MKRIFASILVAAAVLIPVASVGAAKPTSGASCTVSGSTVTATGLPNRNITFLEEASFGTYSTPVGRPTDGTLVVESHTSPAVYSFVTGPHETVLATC